MPRVRASRASWATSGSSWTQGAHQLAHTCTISGRPWCCFMVARSWASEMTLGRTGAATAIPPASRAPSASHVPLRFISWPASTRAAPERPARYRSAVLLELDPAADALGLAHRRGLARGDGLEGVLEVALGHLVGLLAVVVDGAVVDQLAGLVEQEGLGRDAGAEGPGHGLVLVDD